MSTRGKKKERPEDVKDFFGGFLDRNSVSCGKTALFFVSDQDCMELGEFFIRAMVGWAGQYELRYELLRVPTETPRLPEMIEDAEELKDLEALDDDETESEKKFIH